MSGSSEMTFKEKRMLMALMEFKDQQLNGAHLPCPRCGGEPRLQTLSRFRDVFVCNVCSIEEKLFETAGKTQLPLEQWDLIRTINAELPEHMRD